MVSINTKFSIGRFYPSFHIFVFDNLISLKKLIPISLALLFLFNLAGYYIAYPVMSWCIKSSVRAGMEAGLLKKKLILVKIPVSFANSPNNRFQMTDEDEFEYMGRMYDISSKVQKGGTIYFYCYADSDEDQLVANLDTHVKSDSAINVNDHKTRSHNSIIKPLKEYLKGVCVPHDILLSGNNSIRYRNFQYFKTLAPDIQSPPPKS